MRFGFEFAFAVYAFLNMKCPGLLLTCVMVLRKTEFTLYHVGVIRKCLSYTFPILFEMCALP